MNRFFSFSETGELTIERIFFDAGYPILFTCTNESGELFLCVCCQNNASGKKWLLAETSCDVILSLLKDNITMREAFLVSGKKRFSILQGETITLLTDVPEDWDGEKSIYLPDAGEYIEAEDGEFDEEIVFYENRRKREKFSEILEDTLSTFNWEIDNIMVGEKNISCKYEQDIESWNIKLNLLELESQRIYCNNSEYNYAA